MKTSGRVNVHNHVSLTLALVGGEWLASCPGHFTPGEKAHGTHWTGDGLGPTAGLDDVEKRKYLTLPGLELLPGNCRIYLLDYSGFQQSCHNLLTKHH
jgi:hypothetical protein